MELTYVIPRTRYEHLLNGQQYTLTDPNGKTRKIRRGGLGSLKKVLEYLNDTEGLLGTIVELQLED